VGGYCAIREWLQTTCTIISGDENELGAVRQVGNLIEMNVGRTEYSYTYSQPVRAGVPYNAQHGTLQASALSPKQTKLMYSFFYDTSMLSDEAARAAANSRSIRVTAALKNMKAMAEGGQSSPMPVIAPAPSHVSATRK
jgi:hypothetical protein